MGDRLILIAPIQTWIFTGEATTRRIRERYLKAVLRQNVAYFDHIGPGEVTTRIQTDTHLIQEGISDKIPITVQFLSTFVTGFVVALVRNWRLALVVSTISASSPRSSLRRHNLISDELIPRISPLHRRRRMGNEQVHVRIPQAHVDTDS